MLNKEDLEEVLLSGSGFENGKKRIQEYFSQEHTSKEYAKFLSNEYGVGGWGSPLSKYSYSYLDHNSKGIRIKVRREGIEENNSITWGAAATIIKGLVKECRYLPRPKLQRFRRKGTY